MSTDTVVFSALPDMRITEEFFEKIDHCFEKVGFRPYGKVKREESGFWAMLFTPETDGCEYIDWSRRDRTLNRGETLMLQYSPGEREFWHVWIYLSGTMLTDSLSIMAYNMGYLSIYSETDRELALRYQFVSQEIHRMFGATETKAIEDFHDEPWFRFSEDEWRTVGDLPPERCEEPHIRLWAADPEKPLDWEEYYDEEELFPESGDRWKPKLPVSYDGRHGEFHLLFTDKSGTRNISLLRNCLCCGGLLPESERGSLFGRPSEDEERRFRRIAWRAKNSDEIIEILGKPDFFLGSVAYPERNAEEGIREQMVYTNLSDNAVVIFKESELGMIIVNYAGKWQGE